MASVALRGTIDEAFGPSGSGGPSISPAQSKIDTALDKAFSNLDQKIEQSDKEAETLRTEADALNKKNAPIISAFGKEREAISAVKVPELKPLPKYTPPEPRDPLEAFGSVASIVAIFGSAMTRAPLTNALNNAAGVMNAYRAQDQFEAKQQYDLWKTNVDNAITTAKFEMDTYKSIMEKHKNNIDAMAKEMEVNAARFGNQNLLTLTSQKQIDQAIKYVDTLVDQTAKLEAVKANLAKAVDEAGPTSEGKNFVLPDDLAKKLGTRIFAAPFRKGQGYVYQDPDTGKWESLPPDARPAPIDTGGAVAPKDWRVLQTELHDEEVSLKSLGRYLATVKDLPTGLGRWATDLSARAKTLFGTQLARDEFNVLDAKVQVQRLLGMSRLSVVGPGAMTEYDAERVIMALGGDPASMLQNPEVLTSILSEIYEDKKSRMDILRGEVERNKKFFSVEVPASKIKPTLEGQTDVETTRRLKAEEARLGTDNSDVIVNTKPKDTVSAEPAPSAVPKVYMMPKNPTMLQKGSFYRAGDGNDYEYLGGPHNDPKSWRLKK